MLCDGLTSAAGIADSGSVEDLHKMPLGVFFKAMQVSHFSFSGLQAVMEAGAHMMFQGL